MDFRNAKIVDLKIILYHIDSQNNLMSSIEVFMMWFEQ